MRRAVSTDPAMNIDGATESTLVRENHDLRALVRPMRRGQVSLIDPLERQGKSATEWSRNQSLSSGK
jgi:hypothetical protein